MNLKRKVYTFNKEEKKIEKYYTEKGEFIKQLGYIACSISMKKVFHTECVFIFKKVRRRAVVWKKGMGLEIVI